MFLPFVGVSRIKNGTNHILRMRDARVYLVVNGTEPVAAYAQFADVLEQADRFWQQEVERSLIFTLPPDLPSAVLRSRRDAIKLVNDVGREILPGFEFEGLVVFPSLPSISESVALSLFDITTQTDAAGNPTQKERFDFPIVLQDGSMWYDRSVKRWKAGAPPASAEPGK